MNVIQKLIFWALNTAENRSILNRWKAEGRIPQSYCRSLQEVSRAVEEEYRREVHKPFPQPVHELYRTK